MASNEKEPIMAKKAEVVETTETETATVICINPGKEWNAKYVKHDVAMADGKKSNRRKWLDHVIAYDGKPESAWVAAVVKKAPAKIKDGSKTRYTAKQWMTWFVKANVVTLKDA